MAQRLFDRIIFIAFCEDRRLLPEKTIPKAYTVAGFHAVTNPRWQNFKNLFRFIDAGNETHGIPQYNGGLFAPHAVDELELPDDALDDLLQHDQQLRLRRRSEPRRAGASLRAVDHGIGKAQGVGVVRRRRKGEPIRLDAAIGQAQAAWHLLHAAGTDRPDRAVHGRGTDRRALRGRGRRVWHFRKGSAPGHGPRRRRILASLPRHLAEPQDRRSGLRQRRVSVPGLRRAGSALPRGHRPPRPVGRSRTRRNSPSRFRRSFCGRTSTASISRPRRSRSRNWPSGFARPVRANCSPSFRRTSSTATRWSTIRRSTRPASIGASGSPTCSPPRKPGEAEARGSIA